MQLSHRNVVQVYDCIEWGGSTALVMEYVDGCDLRALLGDGPLPLPSALFVCIEVLRGLDYAHRRLGSDGHSLEVVHRDVAPGNILLSREGEVKLADFGLARSRERLDKSHAGIKGTFAFMAPEQAEGGTVDARADVFATGAVLYAMLSGRSPFEADGPLATLDNVRAARFAPLGLGTIDALLGRALRREPAERFATAGAMQAALEELAHGERLKLDPAPLAERVAARSTRRLRLPDALSATQPKPAPALSSDGDSRREAEPAAASPGGTRVLAARPRRPARALPLLLGALLLGGGVLALLWRQPPPSRPVPPAPVLAVAVPPPSPVARPDTPPQVRQIAASPPPVEAHHPRPRPGYLTVSADPWAYVFIDGRKRGTTPLTDVELTPGEHEVTLENPPLGASRVKTLRVAAGEHRTLIEKLSVER
jgi:serine/threonine-protein kinase